MGNTPITVGLRTDQDRYSAGSKVTGRVYVSISKEPQPVQALMLKIVGAEDVVIHHTSSHSGDRHNNDRRHRNSSHSRTEHHYERANVTFLQLEYPLHTFPQGRLTPGQYEYPFEIQLPHNMPSTMACHDGESHCDVKYELTATLQKTNSGIFSPNPSAQQQVEIASTVPASKAVQQSRHLPLEQIPVNNCCCHGKGNMALEMKVDRTAVQPHDTANVEFRCQNQSSVKVIRMCVQIEEIVDWRCHGQHETLLSIPNSDPRNNGNAAAKSTMECRPLNKEKMNSYLKVGALRSYGFHLNRRIRTRAAMFKFDMSFRFSCKRRDVAPPIRKRAR
jgi:hypothetical protein